MEDSDFEWDPDKDRQNLAKHGIGFDQAKDLWLDSDLYILRSDHDGEDRWLAIGLMGLKFWTVIFTWREDKIRIISARRSRLSEIEEYER